MANHFAPALAEMINSGLAAGGHVAADGGGYVLFYNGAAASVRTGGINNCIIRLYSTEKGAKANARGRQLFSMGMDDCNPKMIFNALASISDFMFEDISPRDKKNLAAMSAAIKG